MVDNTCVSNSILYSSNWIFVSILLTLLVLIPTNVFAQSKLIMDAMLPESIPGSQLYPDTPKWNMSMGFTEGKICTSNVCKGIVDESSTGLLLAIYPTYIRFWGDFRLLDDSNAKYSPMKRALVENIGVESSCEFTDIQEDQITNTTTYLCGKTTDSILLTRNINDTSYYFRDMNMTVELPSRHFTLEATEE